MRKYSKCTLKGTKKEKTKNSPLNLKLSIVDELISKGINEKDIVQINLDKRGVKNIKTAKQLELATKLTGRYIEIEMFPLNFYELRKFHNSKQLYCG